MKKSTCIAAFAALGLGVIVVSGALAMSAGRPAPDNRIDQDRHACFDPGRVRSFDTVSEHKMIIVSDWNEAYELGLGGVCIGLDTNFSVGIRSRGGMSDICGPLDGEIVYRDMGSGPLQTCSITSVRHLTGEEAAPYVVKRKSDRSE